MAVDVGPSVGGGLASIVKAVREAKRGRREGGEGGGVREGG